MKNIYLAYAADDEQRAEEVRRLLQAQGHRPWLDPQPIAGADWHIGVDAAIRRAEALVVLVTQQSGTAPKVIYEWAFALGADIPVFAIVYEDSSEHARLGIVKRYNLRAFSDENHFWDHFLADLQRQLRQLEEERGQRIGAGGEHSSLDLSVQPSEPGYWLIMRRGPSPNQLYRLERETLTVGRDRANDIMIPDAQVSRYQFRLALRGVDYQLEDLNSTNGTRINGELARQPTALSDGAIISIGNTIVLSYTLVYPK